jgi:hypothetical protein
VTAARRAQRGLVRGCCLLGVAAVAIVGAVVFLAVRSLAAPDLGAAPQGPDHGDTETAIAVTLASQAVAELLAQPHAVVTLSEHDLTVLAAAHHPDDLSDVSARIRDQLIVLSGHRPFGPLTFTPVAHVSIRLDVTKSPPDLSSRVVELDVGQLGMPGFIRDRILGSFASTIDLNRLFSGSPALQALRANLECVAVVPEGLRVGVRRPGAQIDTSVCAS